MELRRVRQLQVALVHLRGGVVEQQLQGDRVDDEALAGTRTCARCRLDRDALDVRPAGGERVVVHPVVRRVVVRVRVDVARTNEKVEFRGVPELALVDRDRRPRRRVGEDQRRLRRSRGATRIRLAVPLEHVHLLLEELDRVVRARTAQRIRIAGGLVVVRIDEDVDDLLARELRLVRDVDEAEVAVLLQRVGTEGLDEVGEAEDLDRGEAAAAVGRAVLADRVVERLIRGERRALGSEVLDEVLLRHDDRVGLQLPARRLLLARKELQRRRLEGGVVDLDRLLRLRRDVDDVGPPPAASEGED